MEPDETEVGTEAAIAAAAALGAPLPRALYRYVTSQDHAVSRDEAAKAVNTPRSAAAFHLDRLVRRGLLETEFRRLSGRSGPGAGRPSKLYRRATSDIVLSLPPRRYDFAADVLASAVAESTNSGTPVWEGVKRVARTRGAELAVAVRERCGERPTRTATVRAAAAVLGDHGYEPRVGERSVVLSNCPFDSLIPRHAELVCAMNLALLDGFARALPGRTLGARLEPTDGKCCVRLDLDPQPRRRN